MQSVFVTSNFNSSTEVKMFTCSDTCVLLLVPKDKFEINIVLTFIAERDRSGVEGHNSSYRKEINETSGVVHGKMCTLLIPAKELIMYTMAFHIHS